MADYSKQTSDKLPVHNTGVNTPDTNQNRGLDTKSDSDNQTAVTVTLMNIDEKYDRTESDKDSVAGQIKVFAMKNNLSEFL